MTSLAQYDRARVALAEASRIDEVLPLRVEVEHIKLYARQIKDRALMAEAAELQLRVERKLGALIHGAKAAGQIAEGRPRKAEPLPGPPDTIDGAAENGSVAEPFPRVTLAEAGIDKKLSMTAQRHASLSERAFEAMISATRDRIIAGRARIIEGEMINGARAVMSSRAEPDDSLDYFPTPPWATRALMEIVLPQVGRGQNLDVQTVWEPACGEGHMAEVLREYFASVTATDVHDYGYDIGPGWDGGSRISDFLVDDVIADDDCPPPDWALPDWIITNPPFDDKAEAFVLRAIELARRGVAMFMRLQWLETGGRYEHIFRDHPPTLIAFFAERVNLCKGCWDPDGTTATAYIWLVWVQGAAPRAPFWIPPGQRQALTRPDDVARFTTHPVTRRDHAQPLPPHDPDTGEILDAEPPPSSPGSTSQAIQSLQTVGRPPHPGPADDGLDIPAFLRRPRDGEARSPFPSAEANSAATAADPVLADPSVSAAVIPSDGEAAA